MIVIAAPMPTRLQMFRNVLVDFRVVISFVLFTSLIVLDLTSGVEPREVFAVGAWQGWLGWGLVSAGLAIRSWAAGILRKGKELAVAGPYSLCRHPLYLGSFLMMLGFCHMLGDPMTYVMVVLPIAAIYWATMTREELRMDETFGARWEAHAAKTPRLLPLRPHLFVATPWNRALWLRNREYRAIVSSLAGLAALEVWRRWF